MGISCNQLRFRRWPSCDPSGYCEIATSAYGLLAMTNPGALCGRRYSPEICDCPWRSLRTQSGRAFLSIAGMNCKCLHEIATAPSGPRNDNSEAITILTSACSYRQLCAGSGTPLPYSARLFVNFTKLFPIHFSVFMIHLIIISTPDTVPRGVRPAAAAGTHSPD